MHRSFALACSAICMVAQSAFAQTPTSSLETYAADARALLEPYVRANVFMGTVLVAKDGKVIFEGAYGLANREWNVPNALETKFRIGSITKQFTATAVLQLAEQGKLTIDDPISTYYADAPASWAKVTLRHLLTHTSGISNYTELPDFALFSIRDHTPEDLIELIRNKPLEFEPGSQFAYSNSGYSILGYVIGKVSGQSYAAYVQQHIFDSLGMWSSGYDSNSPLIAKRAFGYGQADKASANAYRSAFSAGALYSTVGDLLLWDQALYANKPLSAGSLKEQFTDYGHYYGFGWVVDTAFGHDRIWHGGAIGPFVSNISRYPQDRLTVIVLSKLAGAPTIERIRNELAGLYYYAVGAKVPELELPEAALAAYTGKYELDSALIVTVARQGSALTLAGSFPPHRLFATGEDEFVYRTLDIRLTFDRDGRGQITGFVLHQDGENVPASIPAIRLTEDQLERRAAALAERRKANLPAPVGDAVLRRYIDGVKRGEPDYANMNLGLANATRQQLPALQRRMNELGRLETVTFKRLGPQGRDVYETKFSNGSLQWVIALNGDKLVYSTFHPIP